MKTKDIILFILFELFVMKTLAAVLTTLILALTAFAQNQTPKSQRILLVPLDDRPPCLQMPVRLGAVADAEIVTPPRELLGNFTVAGQSDKIIEWLKTQDLKRFDAAVVSLDMLAYGGLVAMREMGATTRETAQKRIDFMREMKRKNPRLPIYASSVIMRLAPTGNVTNEAYRAKLARYAEIVSETADAKLQAEAKKLAAEIPADAMANYKSARARDLAGNFQAIELAKNGTFDYLILSQDDAHPTGVHVAERESLIKKVNELKLQEKIPVQPGADEVSMLLLARLINKKYNFAPRVLPVYSSEATRQKVMPFEDRKLFETVSYHIKAVGGREVASEKDADVLFYVYASRLENERYKSFADEIEKSLNAGKRLILVDVDLLAKTEGGDPNFMEEIKRRGIVQRLSGFAAWNTAGNMIGTALPQGVMFEAVEQYYGSRRSPQAIAINVRSNAAQKWFLLHRFIDDYVYNTIVRTAAKNFANSKKYNVFRFTPEQSQEVEAASFPVLRERYNADKVAILANTNCRAGDDVSYDLPWGRTFEAEISFDLTCNK